MDNNWYDNFIKDTLKNHPDYENEKSDYDLDSISVKKRKIFAYFVNDDNTSHEIKISFKEFSDCEKNILKETISDNPVFSFKLNNRIVPDELFDCGVSVFPSSMDDLNIEYSDDEFSCSISHILDVLRHFKNKLEKNRFLIFSLRGFDLKIKETFELESIDDIFINNFKSNSDSTVLNDLYEINMFLLNDSYSYSRKFDFIYEELFKIFIDEVDLISRPSKYFKEYVKFNDFPIYEKLNAQSVIDRLFKQKWCIKSKSLVIDVDSQYNLTPFANISDESKFLAFILESKQTGIKNYVLSFLGEILDLTFDLIKHNAIMPQLFTSGDYLVILRWIPAFFSDEVLNLCRSYYDRCPDNLITFQGKKISKENQVIIAVSLIVKGLEKYCLEKERFSYIDHDVSVSAGELLVDNVTKLNSHHITTSIITFAKKLSVFHMKEMDFRYVLCVSEGFEIEIKIKTGGRYKSLDEASFDELKFLNIIYELFSRFKIKNRLLEKIHLDNGEFLIFHRKIRPFLDCLNVDVEMPFEVEKADTDVLLDIDVDEENFTLDDLNRYFWLFKVGDLYLTIDEYKDSNDGLNELIKARGRYFIVDKKDFRMISDGLFHLSKTIEHYRVLQIALLEECFGLKIVVSDRFKNLINASSIYDVPKSLTGKLRPYQKIGYSWLVQNIKTGFGSILADDMGLGKTVQVLAAILYLKENNHLQNRQALVIVPTTLISNWENEIKKFAPDLSYDVYHGPGRKFPEDNIDVVLTSFGVVRIDFDLFLNKSWMLCVVDEAQNIKNPKSLQTLSIKSIDAFNKIALTGTPIENKLLDYWSIFDFTNKGYLFSQSEFSGNYLRPIQKGKENILEKFKKITKPFVLRRLKTDGDVIRDLPEKTVNDIYCRLNEKQIRLYNDTFTDLFENIEEEKSMSRRGNIFKLLTALKQICNHPAQFLKLKNPKIGDSAKFELLIDILENILDAGEKVIIFTQYLRMAEIIEELVSEKFKINVAMLHGSVSQNKRGRIIDRFQEDDSYPVMVATLKTGGTGLNLTAAQNVIHYDLWWNPAVENQATDRVYRIGQENDVMVYRLINKGTLEEQIDSMIKNKLDLAGKAIDSDETFITEMSNDELKEILSLRL